MEPVKDGIHINKIKKKAHEFEVEKLYPFVSLWYQHHDGKNLYPKSYPLH